MIFYDYAWPGNFETCPCDLHFTQFLDEHHVTQKTIFHFGTGLHHHVGIHAYEARKGNKVLGITASPGEHEAYVRLAIAQPELSAVYKVLFGDIYLTDPALLPSFDIITLFHLGEFPDPERSAYGAMSDADLVATFARCLRLGGELVFYTGSMGWPTVAPIVAELEADAEHWIEFTPYKTLRRFVKKYPQTARRY